MRFPRKIKKELDLFDQILLQLWFIWVFLGKTQLGFHVKVSKFKVCFQLIEDFVDVLFWG